MSAGDNIIPDGMLNQNALNDCDCGPGEMTEVTT
jgi:hypothetical protein